jgi:DNA-binding transcriptional LysR family regulator
VKEGTGLLTRSAAVRRRVRAARASAETPVVGFRPGIIVSDVLRRFTEQYPRVAVVAQRIEWDEQDAAVLDGRVDIAWVRTPIRQSGLEIVPLHEDPETIALPRDHPLATKSVVTVADLRDQPLLRYDTAPLHHAGRIASFSGVRTMEEKLEAVALGHGLALVPRSAAEYYQRPDIVYLPVGDAEPYHVALAMAADRSDRPEIAAFVRVAATLQAGR